MGAASVEKCSHMSRSCLRCVSGCVSVSESVSQLKHALIWVVAAHAVFPGVCQAKVRRRATGWIIVSAGRVNNGELALIELSLSSAPGFSRLPSVSILMLEVGLRLTHLSTRFMLSLEYDVNTESPTLSLSALRPLIPLSALDRRLCCSYATESRLKPTTAPSAALSMNCCS